MAGLCALLKLTAANLGWLARREQNKVWRRLGLEFCIQHFIACRMLRLIHRPDRVKEPLKNKVRQLGFIDYNGDINVYRSLLSLILHD